MCQCAVTYVWRIASRAIRGAVGCSHRVRRDAVRTMTPFRVPLSARSSRLSITGTLFTPQPSRHTQPTPHTHTRQDCLVSSTTAWSAPPGPLHPARPSRPASSGTHLSAHSSRPASLGPIFQARPSRTTLGPLSGFPVCPPRLVTLCTTLPTRLSLHAPSDPPFTTHPPSPRAATALPTNPF